MFLNIYVPGNMYKGPILEGTERDLDIYTAGIIDHSIDIYRSLRDEYGIEAAPRAASPDHLCGYYSKVLGNRVTEEELLGDGYYLHFTTTHLQLSISSQGSSTEGLNRKIYTARYCGEPGFTTKIKVEEIWRNEQPIDLKLDFIVVHAISSDSALRKYVDKSTPVGPCLLTLMPVEWVEEPGRGRSTAVHKVAYRIAQVSLIKRKDPEPGEEYEYDLDCKDWMSLRPAPQEVFVVLA